MSEYVLRERIRQARRALGLTQEQLAERLNRGQQTVYSWERGTRHPRRSDMQRLAEVLDKPLAWFFTTEAEDKTSTGLTSGLSDRLTKLECLLQHQTEVLEQQTELLKRLLLEIQGRPGEG